MAVAAAPRVVAKKRDRAVPDDAVIYREYAHQVMTKGEWGAYSRTARICKVSQPHVTRVVARHEAKKKPEDLPYEPAPGEVEYQQTREALASQLQQEELLCQLLAQEVQPATPHLTSTPRSIELQPEPEIQQTELHAGTVDYDPFFNRLPSREYQNRVYQVRVLFGVVVVLLLMTMLVGSKSFGLFLALFPEVMGSLWVTLQLRRLLYLRPSQCTRQGTNKRNKHINENG